MPTRLTPTEGTSALLFHFQRLLSCVIQDPEILGVSTKEYETFRNDFGNSAHTCRLHSCPRATVGFESEKRVIEHEAGHIRRHACKYPSCQYPPFLTQQALQNHVRREHDADFPRKSIRRVPGTINRAPDETQQTARESAALSKSFMSSRSIPPQSVPLAKGNTTDVPQQSELGQVSAPPPPGEGDPPLELPPTPEWLNKALDDLQKRWKYDDIGGTMRHCAVHADTRKPIRPAIRYQLMQQDVEWVFAPRIRCRDCPGKLYTPGPGMSAENFTVHLRNKQHRANVNKRVGIETDPEKDRGEPSQNFRGRPKELEALD